jgi:hypothetical protein
MVLLVIDGFGWMTYLWPALGVQLFPLIPSPLVSRNFPCSYGSSCLVRTINDGKSRPAQLSVRSMQAIKQLKAETLKN